MADRLLGVVKEKGGQSNGTPGVATATGDLTGTFVAQNNRAKTYGRFTIDAAGTWTYTMNDAHDEFVGGQDYTDSITVKTADGTSQLIAVTMHGTDDATVITGTSTAALTETNEAQTKSIMTTLGDVLPKRESELEKVQKDVGYDTVPTADQKTFTCYKAVGCRECVKGYKGRIGIYEVFAMTPDMEKLLLAHSTTSEVQAQASKDGMLTMKQDGYFKALNALTTLEEVARVAADF